MSLDPHPHWSDNIPPILFVLALLVCGGAFIYGIGTLIRFVAPFIGA